MISLANSITRRHNHNNVEFNLISEKVTSWLLLRCTLIRNVTNIYRKINQKENIARKKKEENVIYIYIYLNLIKLVISCIFFLNQRPTPQRQTHIVKRETKISRMEPMLISEKVNKKESKL